MVLHLELASRVVVMLAPFTLFQVVNRKSIVALFFTLVIVCLNAVCDFIYRHFRITIFLASAASDFVTGTAIPISGGYSIAG